MDYQSIITIEPGKRSGKPCIRGLRITVYDILEYLAGGMTEAEILEDFSELTSEDIKACLAFAADREKVKGKVFWCWRSAEQHNNAPPMHTEPTTECRLSFQGTESEEKSMMQGVVNLRREAMLTVVVGNFIG